MSEPFDPHATIAVLRRMTDRRARKRLRELSAAERVAVVDVIAEQIRAEHPAWFVTSRPGASPPEAAAPEVPERVQRAGQSGTWRRKP